MVKRLFIYSFCLLITIALIGCVTLGKKKAPSKPFGEVTLSIPKDIESYQGKYKTIYVVWEALSEEMIQLLGKNRMRTLNTREQIILALEKMQGCLIDEGKELLIPHIEDFKATTEKLMERRLNQGGITRLKRVLSRKMTKIQKRFSYQKAKQWIRPDVVEISPEYLESEE